MTNMPDKSLLSDPTTIAGSTAAIWAAEMAKLYAVIAEQSGNIFAGELTISLGSVTITGGAHSIDTEADAASDDLTNINSVNIPDARTLFIEAADVGRVVTIKHSAGGSGQIITITGSDVTLAEGRQMLLKKSGDTWKEIATFGTGSIKKEMLDLTQIPTLGENTFLEAQRGNILPLTDQASIATNLKLSNLFSVTLAGNRTLANPTNIIAGQEGAFFISQDATGGRTLSFGSYFEFAEGETPDLSTAANAVDRLDYIVRTPTSIHAVLSHDVKPGV